MMTFRKQLYCPSSLRRPRISRRPASNGGPCSGSNTHSAFVTLWRGLCAQWHHAGRSSAQQGPARRQRQRQRRGEYHAAGCCWMAEAAGKSGHTATGGPGRWGDGTVHQPLLPAHLGADAAITDRNLAGITLQPRAAAGAAAGPGGAGGATTVAAAAGALVLGSSSSSTTTTAAAAHAGMRAASGPVPSCDSGCCCPRRCSRRCRCRGITCQASRPCARRVATTTGRASHAASGGSPSCSSSLLLHTSRTSSSGSSSSSSSHQPVLDTVAA